MAKTDAALDALRSQLLDAQFDLSRERGSSVLVIATGLAAAGRTEALTGLRRWFDPKHVLTSVWGARNDLERARPWAYRYWRALPRKGEIAVWFDGWYGDLLSLLLDPGQRREARARAREIVATERMLHADGVRIVKWHFDISAPLQRHRLKNLLADDLNRWRVSKEDLRNRKRHSQFVRAHRRLQRLTMHADAGWQVFRDAHHDEQMPMLARSLLTAMKHRAAPAPRRPWKRPPALSSRAARQVLELDAPTRVTRVEDEPMLLKSQSRMAHALQTRRWRKRSLVIVLEGMDAAGKSGATQRIIDTMDPRRYRIVPISAPTAQEAAYPYLWRFWPGLPARGAVSIFDRSWYGRVLVERVRGFATPADWARAYQEINDFEQQMIEHRIHIAKFWFAISKAEQARRFKARESSPLKRFKVDPEDWKNRRHWNAFQTAAADMIALTSSKHAPWTIIAADDKTHARAAILEALCRIVEA